MTDRPPLRICLLGTRGIPANYGGFETFAEELSIRLARRGHDVTVYGRSNYVDATSNTYRGVRLVVLPTIRHKYFDTVFHTFISSLHILGRGYDIALVCNSANSPFCLMPRMLGTKVVLNVDGLEWQRKKWNSLGRNYYRLCSRLSVWAPSVVVSDAESVQRYYRQRFGAELVLITYGSKTLDAQVTGTDALKQFGLEPGRYILYVSRLEPENNAHVVVKAFEQVKTDMKLAVVGYAPYSDDYIRDLHATQDKRVVFTGGVYGDGYLQLQRHARLYVQATEVGGTHPALLEGLGTGNCVLYNEVPEHREVVGDAGVSYSGVEDLVKQLQFLVDHPEVADEYGKKGKARVQERYQWEEVVDRYENLFYSVINGTTERKDTRS